MVMMPRNKIACVNREGKKNDVYLSILILKSMPGLAVDLALPII